MKQPKKKRVESKKSLFTMFHRQQAMCISYTDQDIYI